MIAKKNYSHCAETAVGAELHRLLAEIWMTQFCARLDESWDGVALFWFNHWVWDIWIMGIALDGA